MFDQVFEHYLIARFVRLILRDCAIVCEVYREFHLVLVEFPQQSNKHAKTNLENEDMKTSEFTSVFFMEFSKD